MNSYTLKPFQIKPGANPNSLQMSWFSYMEKTKRAIGGSMLPIFWVNIPVFLDAYDSGAIAEEHLRRCILNNDTLWTERPSKPLGFLARAFCERGLFKDWVADIFYEHSSRPGADRQDVSSSSFRLLMLAALEIDLSDTDSYSYNTVSNTLYKYNVNQKELEDKLKTYQPYTFNSILKFMREVQYIDVDDTIANISNRFSKEVNAAVLYYKCTDEIKNLIAMPCTPGVDMYKYYRSLESLYDKEVCNTHKLEFDRFAFDVRMLALYEKLWETLDEPFDKMLERIKVRASTVIDESNVVTFERLLDKHPEHKTIISIAQSLMTASPLLDLINTSNLQIEVADLEGIEL